MKLNYQGNNQESTQKKAGARQKRMQEKQEGTKQESMQQK